MEPATQQLTKYALVRKRLPTPPGVRARYRYDVHPFDAGPKARARSRPLAVISPAGGRSVLVATNAGEVLRYPSLRAAREELWLHLLV